MYFRRKTGVYKSASLDYFEQQDKLINNLNNDFGYNLGSENKNPINYELILIKNKNKFNYKLFNERK